MMDFCDEKLRPDAFTMDQYDILASCQKGPATAHWLGILTEMYVILSDNLNATDAD